MSDEPEPRECELGPIRPPSEALSLLVRVTRNCPWNKCSFCPVYKRTRFSRRGEQEVIGEIDLLARAAERVRSRAGSDGEGGIDARAALDLVRDPGSTDDERRVALWLARGGRHVFLQDADSLAIKPERLARIVSHLTRTFPRVERVTSYSRSRTLCARSPEQLAALREAGLTRIHVGVESGSDEVLAMVKKGARAEHHLRGCRRVVEGGFDLCCYVMPALGGRRLSEVHARETARVLREIDPHHVRLRTLWIDPGAPLAELHARGEFDYPEEHEIVAEIRELLAGLRGARSEVISDHDRNLLVDLEGHATRDADRMLAHCDRLAELDPKTRDAFVLARRSGYFRTLDAFLARREGVETFRRLVAEILEEGEGSLVRGMERQLRPRRL